MAVVTKGAPIFLAEEVTTVSLKRVTVRGGCRLDITLTTAKGESQTMTFDVPDGKTDDIARMFLGAPVRNSLNLVLQKIG